MQQRRVRLGDVLDDYCPRERRITNHVVVAMIDESVKQTRCTTCEAEHEYKEAKVPAARRRRSGALALGDPESAGQPRPVLAPAEPADEPVDELESLSADEAAAEPVSDEPVEPLAAEAADVEPEDERVAVDQDEWPVHRPLIRATLPRPEGQAPERKAPDFTFRPAGGRFDAQRNGQRQRHRGARQAQGQSSGQGRFGGARQGGSGQGQRHGNRQGPGGGRPGQGRGPRPGGSGRKRGR